MQKFKDAEGREWTIRLTIGAVDRVKGEFEGTIDLLNLAAGKPPLVSQLDSDPALLAHVIYVLAKCRDYPNMSQEDFADLLDAPTFAAAEKAFWAELEDFFQTTGRSDLCRLIEAQKEVREGMQEAMKTKVDELTEMAIEKMQSLATSGQPSGSLPESVDLILSG